MYAARRLDRSTMYTSASMSVKPHCSSLFFDSDLIYDRRRFGEDV